jgi:chromosome segregation ATPase
MMRVLGTYGRRFAELEVELADAERQLRTAARIADDLSKRRRRAEDVREVMEARVLELRGEIQKKAEDLLRTPTLVRRPGQARSALEERYAATSRVPR